MNKKPPSVIKMTKNGLEYTNKIDRTAWTLKGLVNGANRDVGRYVVRQVRNEIRASGFVRTGRMMRSVQFFAKRNGYLNVGYKLFYGGFHETGTRYNSSQNWLRNAVYNNIDTIREIQGKYIASVEDENKAMSRVLVDDEVGDD